MNTTTAPTTQKIEVQVGWLDAHDQGGVTTVQARPEAIADELAEWADAENAGWLVEDVKIAGELFHSLDDAFASLED